MIDLLYIIFANLFRTIVISRFMNVFYCSKKFRLPFTLISYFLYFLVTALIYLSFHNILFNILVNFSGIYFLTFLYKSSNMKRLASAAIIYLLNMACDGFIYIALSNYKVGHSVTEMYSILTSMLLFLIELIAERLFKEKESLSIPVSKWLTLLCIPLVSGIVIFFQILFLEERFKTIITVLGILLLNILLFYLYSSILEYYKEKWHKSLLEKEVAAYSNQLKIYEKTQKSYDSLKHDINHHIRMIKGYLDDHDVDSVSKYLNSISSEYFSNNLYVNSGNKEIDSVLNYMISVAKSTLTNVTYNIRIPANMPYDALTLNVVLGNLLENAIYASQQSEEQFLKISLSLKKGLLYIDIYNSYSGKLKIKKEKFLSTKKNPELHGIGLENVKEILSRNNNTLKIDYQNNTFEAHVLYYLP